MYHDCHTIIKREKKVKKWLSKLFSTLPIRKWCCLYFLFRSIRRGRRGSIADKTKCLISGQGHYKQIIGKEEEKEASCGGKILFIDNEFVDFVCFYFHPKICLFAIFYVNEISRLNMKESLRIFNNNCHEVFIWW